MRETIRWETAEVKRGKLTVQLSVQPKQDIDVWERWALAFVKAQAAVSTLHPECDDVTVDVANGRIEARRVSAVDAVAHYLEDVVERANEVLEDDMAARLAAVEEGRRRVSAGTAEDQVLTARYRARSTGW